MRFVRCIKRKEKKKKIHYVNRSRSDTETVEENRTKNTSIYRDCPLQLARSFLKHFSTQTTRPRYFFYDVTLKIARRERKKNMIAYPHGSYGITATILSDDDMSLFDIERVF